MTIVSEKNGVIIASHAWVAKSFWQRFCGLMFRASVKEGEAVIFYGASSIHMFFMRFPIDVIYLNKKSCVAKVVRGLRPWAMSGCFGAYATIECAAGSLSDDLSVGDAILIKES